MTTFSFQGLVEVTMEYHKDARPEIIQVKYELKVQQPLSAEAYLLPDKRPNKDGLKLLTTAYVQGLAGCVDYAKANKYAVADEMVNYILNQLKEVAKDEPKKAPTGAGQVSFQGMSVVTMQHDGVSPTSSIKNVNFNLTSLTNLRKEEYLQPDDLPTENGIKILTVGFIQALGACMAYGRINQAWDGDHLEYVIDQFLRVVKVENKEIFPSFFEEERPTRRSTNVDLVEELKARNKDGRYDLLIHRASNYWYHDFKQPDDVPHLPKIQLINDLGPFPELADIREKVLEDVYDEPADENDMREMAKFLMPRKD